ncbi:MAG: hypothetical protein M1818_004982 [Claussenomyces sp. TS43310]|nr:MAG: hypothetical protein M1818_004982 [Claussenomyces sp. TS43310]
MDREPKAGVPARCRVRSPQSSTHENPRSVDASCATTQRFVGDLNPEATFLEDSPLTAASKQPSRGGDIGVWLDRDEWNAIMKRREAAMNGNVIRDEHTLQPHQARHMEMIEPSDQNALIEVYFSRIHPILPILDEQEFRQGYGDKLMSNILIAAMCLVAATDDRAEPHLRLHSPSTGIDSCREYTIRLYQFIKEALWHDLDCDRMSLIRIHALLSLSLYREGPNGAEEASLHLAQAIHHAQTIGLHLARTDNTGHSDASKKLFWKPMELGQVECCHQRIAMYAPGNAKDAAFEVWLQISTMLNNVISFYRPKASGSTTGWEDDFPGFEEILIQHKALNLPDLVLATLHLFYQIVAILSSRSRSIKDIPPSTFSHVRQSLSAKDVISLMTGETN